MRQTFMRAVLVFALTGVVSGAAAQTTDDVKRLNGEIAILRKQVKNLEKENELLKREIELMKKEAKSKPDAPKDKKTEAKSRTKGSSQGVEYELLKCVRDSKQRTRVAFTFLARAPSDRKVNAGVCRKMSLITSDLKEIKDGNIVAPPGGFRPLRLFLLEKGESAKFQVIFEGVDEEVTEFDQVELEMGGTHGATAFWTIRFSGIKIESK